MPMSTPDSSNPINVSRRRFLKQSSLAVAGVAAAAQLPLARMAHAAGPDLEIKIGLIGCGGRGTGALLDALGAATNVIYPQDGYHTEDVAQGAVVQRKGIKVVGLADLFEDRLVQCRSNLDKLGIKVAPEMCFTGIDAYKQLLAVSDINYVILATSPHFRPIHLDAAVNAGKHVFMEKPAAVDVPGIKMVIEAGERAKQKGLGIVAGTQRRHLKSYQETIKRIHDGAIGEIIYGRCYWNGSQIWVVDRQPGWSDMEYQLRNWEYFTWLSGDHIAEQHVHNLDIMNWVLGSHPVRAFAAHGGRQVRTGDRHGYVYDHFSVDYEYPNGVHMFSQCRQINGCDWVVAEGVEGTNGSSNVQTIIKPKNGDRWKFRGEDPNPYKQEHEDLIVSIRQGNPLNEARTVAESTMTGILGREAAYTGKALDWDVAMQSTKRLGPENYDLGPCPVPSVPMPGQYKFS